MTELAGIGVGSLGAGGLLAIVILMILTGRLVPRSTLEDMKQERDTWRAAFQESEQARHLAQEHSGELLELSRTAVPLLRALPTAEEVSHGPLDMAP